MRDVSEFVGDASDLIMYAEILEVIRERTDEYFLDVQDAVYKDIISKTNQLKECAFTTHFGYPNLLPIAFGIIQDGSQSLKNTIEKMTDPNILWSDYGLRSLSISDPYFTKG